MSLVETVGKVVAVKGKVEAFVGAIGGTVISVALIVLGAMKMKRNNELRDHPESKDPATFADGLPAAWIMFVCAALLLVGSWGWFYATMKWKAAAILEGLG